MKGIGLLSLVGLALAGPSLPAPSGPISEARSDSLNVVLRVSECVREAGQVRCAISLRNLAGQQRLVFEHRLTRLVAPNGVSYPGYLDLEGGQLTNDKSTISLRPEQTVSGQAIFPAVGGDAGFISLLSVGGLELRGINIVTPTFANQGVLSGFSFALERCAPGKAQIVCQGKVTNTTAKDQGLGLYRPLNAQDSADFGKLVDDAGLAYRLVKAGFGSLEGQVFQTLPPGVATRFEVAYEGEFKGREVVLLAFTTSVGELRFRQVPINR